MHRRSLSSETVSELVSWPNAAPSDKARCHMLQRTLAPTRTHTSSLQPLSNYLVLVKIAEIMQLKDQHYKPRNTPKLGDETSSNPFTTLAQFRGVKKILDGSPNSCTIGANNLFSSCFELPSPFFATNHNSDSKVPNMGKNMETINKKQPCGSDIGNLKSNSLPSSPILSRQNSYEHIDSKDTINSAPSGKHIEQCVNKLAVLNINSKHCGTSDRLNLEENKNQPLKGETNNLLSSICDSDFNRTSESNSVYSTYMKFQNNIHQKTLNNGAPNSQNTSKPKSLYSHPLFKSTTENELSSTDEHFQIDSVSNSDSNSGDSSNFKKTSPILLQKSNSNIELSSDNPFSPSVLALKNATNVMRRRGSCESGIFSVVNEDFSSPNFGPDCYHTSSICPCVLRFFCHCKCPATDKCLFAKNSYKTSSDSSGTQTDKAVDSHDGFECYCKLSYNSYLQNTAANLDDLGQDSDSLEGSEFCCNNKKKSIDKLESDHRNNETDDFRGSRDAPDRNYVRSDSEKKGCDHHLSLCHNCLDNYYRILHNKYWHKNINVGHALSCRTISSSSANSSLFLLDDSAMSTTTVSSLRSLDDLDCLNQSSSREHLRLAQDAENFSLSRWQRKADGDEDDANDVDGFGKKQNDLESVCSESDGGTICVQCNSYKVSGDILPLKECQLMSRCCLLYHNKRNNVCPIHKVNTNIDVDTRSVNLELINRLAMDEEIHNIMMRAPITNQLLYSSSKRASSIYTDSSDDISSLAGSDSLHFDDRAYSGISNARSAQISKIVEYFERKGANFKSPGYKTNIASGTSSYANSRIKLGVSKFSGDALFPSKVTRKIQPDFLDVRKHFDNDVRNISESQKEYSFGETGRKMAELRHRLNNQNKFSDLCTNTDVTTNMKREDVTSLPSCSRKCLSQQRLIICEGAVKSKLSLFDRKK